MPITTKNVIARNLKMYYILLNGFTQMIKSPTRVTKDSSAIIDIIASNNESNIKDTVTIPTSLSDHFMVGSLCKLNH